mgnify:FL=1
MRIMNRLTKLILAADILRLSSILIGQIFSNSILDLISIILLSDSGIFIGVEAIGKQIYTERSRYDRRAIETYIGIAAVLQGILLIIIGLYFFLTALSTIIGYIEQKQGHKWNIFLELIASRLLPGIILIAIALIAICLGVIEIASPEYFDKVGGGFLKIFFS